MEHSIIFNVQKNGEKYLKKTLICSVVIVVTALSGVNQAFADTVDNPSTLSNIRADEVTYLKTPTLHALSTTTGNMQIVINGTTYYYTPDASEDSNALETLATTGSSALITTTDASKAVYSYNGIYYTYDVSKLPSTSFTLQNGSGTNWDITNYSVSDDKKTVTEVPQTIKLNTTTLGTSDGLLYYNWSKDNNGNLVLNASDTQGTGLNDLSVTYKSHHNNISRINNTTPLTEINGDFSQQFLVSQTDELKGAALYNSSTIDLIQSSFYQNNLKSNNGVSGGAIYNNGTITTITGDFYQNYAEALQDFGACGGAIVNTDKIGTITGNFIENHANSNSEAYGGAIYNMGTILNLNSNFIGNYVNSSNKSYGGAIYNISSISNITGEFLANHVNTSQDNAQGGAIYNYATSSITNITGDFIGNYAKSTASNAMGGAIFNSSSSNLENITGDFIGNYVYSDAIYVAIQGGAIYNQGTITNLTGDFLKNFANSNSSGGAIYNTGTIFNVSGDFVGNYIQNDNNTASTIYGGAIYNSGTINNINGNFIGNYSKHVNTSSYTGGGAIYNSGTISSISGDFINNYSETNSRGGAICNNGGTIGLIEGDFINNAVLNNDQNALDSQGGAIYNDGNGVIKVNGNFVGNHAFCSGSHALGGAIFSDGNTNMTVTGNFINNYAYSTATANPSNLKAMAQGGAINLNANSNLTLDATDNDIFFKGNYVKSTLNLNHGGAIYNGSNLSMLAGSKHTISFLTTPDSEKTVSGAEYDTIYADSGSKFMINDDTHDGTIVLGTAIKSPSNNDIEYQMFLNNGSLKLLSTGSISPNVDMGFNGGTLDLANSVINTMNFNKISLLKDSNLILDVNEDAKTMDTIVAKDINISNNSKLNVTGLNIYGTPAEGKFNVEFIGSKEGNTNLLGHVQNKVSKVVTPIYIYDVNYEEDATNKLGMYSFGVSRKNSFNPAIIAPSVAAQLGGYSTQLESYNQGFSSMDKLMGLTSSEIIEITNRNKYAIKDVQPVYNASTEKDGWFNPYTSFEKVNLNNGPQINSISYGSYFGGDSDIYSLKHGWNGMYSLFAGYNGSYQYFNGLSMNQNGGALGFSGTAFKRNFFTGLTVSAGDSAVEASSIYGNDTFNMLTAGIASKTGYNFELKGGKYVLQPSLMLAYSFINTFDYRNAAGVKITSDPLNAITIQPQIKFITNLKNGWSPYVSVSMVWNAMDSAKFKANYVSLPNVSIDPYVQYGIGLSKKFGENTTGFAQAMVRNGGRNGIALSFGFKWAIGRKPKCEKV